MICLNKDARFFKHGRITFGISARSNVIPPSHKLSSLSTSYMNVRYWYHPL